MEMFDRRSINIDQLPEPLMGLHGAMAPLPAKRSRMDPSSPLFRSTSCRVVDVRVVNNNNDVSGRVEWDPITAEYVNINGGMHGRMLKIPKVAMELANTETFSRLKRIKQLGPCLEVYPDATHNRFSHCLGTADLARRVMKKLCESKELGISGNDVLCVIIAGLSHDLGHGPFSHLFEKLGFPERGHIPHELMSIRLFKFILDQNPMLQVFKYLSHEDFIFIEELIHPTPAFDGNKNWARKGRKQHKAFLYSIISDSDCGVDVDRIDYILRDSSRCSVPVSLDTNAVDRIINSLYVKIDPTSNLPRIHFAAKTHSSLASLYSARILLHENVYSHKTAIAVEYELQKALKAAGPWLKFSGTRGKLVALEDIHTDLVAFSKLDDSVETMILNDASNLPGMMDAQKHIRNIHARTLPKCITQVSQLQAEPNVAELQEFLRNNLSYLNIINQINVCSRQFHSGFGLGVDIMSKVPLHHKDGGEHRLWRTDVPSYCNVYVYAPYTVTKGDADLVHQWVTRYVRNNGIKGTPVNLFSGI